MKHLVFKRGLRDGIPIGLGYFVVSIGIGIACRTAKLGAAQGFFMSLLNNASAGEYGGITVIAGDAGFLTMILMMLVSSYGLRAEPEALPRPLPGAPDADGL